MDTPGTTGSTLSFETPILKFSATGDSAIVAGIIGLAIVVGAIAWIIRRRAQFLSGAFRAITLVWRPGRPRLEHHEAPSIEASGPVEPIPQVQPEPKQIERA